MNTKNDAHIQVRIDSVTKKTAQKVLERVGLDTSTAVKILFKQIALTGSFPIELKTINGFTRSQETQMMRETKEALAFGESYSSAKEMHKDILK